MNSDEEQAFAGLYREHYGRVLRFVGRRIGPGPEAEDVTADIFRLAWAKAVQGSPLSPGWLFVTARNTLNNRNRFVVRTERAHQTVAAGMRSALAARSSADRTVEIVDETLAGLRDMDREILLLAYWDEMTASEIAGVLDVSVSAVWVRLHRARRAFRAVFATTIGGHSANR